MIWLIFSILSSFFIVLTFKYLEKKRMPLFPIVVLNYFSAGTLGFFIYRRPFGLTDYVESPWFYVSLIIGVLLIVMFWVIGFSTQRAGVAVTTVSNKMSVILPITFSIVYYSEALPDLKILGIILAILAVFLSVWKKRTKSFSPEQVYLPLILFAGVGSIDVLIKYSQQDLLSEGEIPLFTSVNFALAGIVGVITAFFNKSRFNDYIRPRMLTTGLLLGAANFGSIYFLLLALEYGGIDSSVVYAVNNIGIIALSVMAAWLIFREKLRPVNWIGFALAVTAIVILTQVR